LTNILNRIKNNKKQNTKLKAILEYHVPIEINHVMNKTPTEAGIAASKISLG
jgi:hypothetical protein